MERRPTRWPRRICCFIVYKLLVLAVHEGCSCPSVGLASVKAHAHQVQWDADVARNLRSVNLGWCERVTEAGVAALAAGCPKLQALDLCGCIRVRLGSPCAAHASTAWIEAHACQ